MVQINKVVNLEDIQQLLSECHLPIEDITNQTPQQFFGAYQDDKLIAMVGLEIYSTYGLLRSLAVKNTYRGQGLALELVLFIEQQAKTQQIETLFLLTTTAADFFKKLGFLEITRSQTPEDILTSSQFSTTCPVSAILLCKKIL